MFKCYLIAILWASFLISGTTWLIVFHGFSKWFYLFTLVLMMFQHGKLSRNKNVEDNL